MVKNAITSSMVWCHHCNLFQDARNFTHHCFALLNINVLKRLKIFSVTMKIVLILGSP